MTNTLLTDLIYAGSFSVDSGQAIIGDPCYLDDYNTNKDEVFNIEGKEGEYSYHGASATTIASNYGELGNSQAVVVSTGYGDGVYPVYVKLNEDGRIVMAIIDFEGELE